MNIAKYLLYFLILLPLCKSFSQDILEPNQTEELIYNSKSKKLSGILPFDKQFRITLKDITAESIDTALIYEVVYKRNKNRNNKKERRVRFFKKKIKNQEYSSNVERDKEIIKFKKNGIRIKNIFEKGFSIEINVPDAIPLEFQPSNEYKKSSFTYVTPLKPERLYEIALMRQNSLKSLLIYFEYFDLYKKNPNDTLTLKKFFLKKILPLEDRKAQREVNIGSLPLEYKKFEEIIKSDDFILLTSNDDRSNLLRSFPSAFFSNLDTITYIGQKLKTNKLNLSVYSNFIKKFIENDLTEIKEFVSGKKLKTKEFDYQKIEKQLKINIKLIDSVRNEIGILRSVAIDSIVDSFDKNFLQKLKTVVLSNHTNISSHFKKSRKVIDKFFPMVELISAATESGDIKTYNAKTIIPDFGLINSFGHNSDGEIKYLARPQFGLNWHIGGINREQPLNEIIDQKFRHRFSIAIGVTLGKIDTEDYEDLYNSISPTLGINWRFTRQVRLGIGSLFLREKDNNPITDSTKVVLAPYLSITFDLGIFESGGKFFNKIGF